MKQCLSCAMPLESNKNPKSEVYCQYCGDEKGELKSREEVKQGLAMWLETWVAGDSKENYQKRAEHYLQSMPAWQ